MKIFLSYASEDRDSAEQVYLALIASGHQVFFDRVTLPPGGDFNSRIRQAIRESDLLIFLISPHSVARSSYTLTELNFARDKWPHPLNSVLPVVLHETEFGSIPNYLKAVTVLEPQRNVAAEVVDWLGRQEETLGKRFMRYITNNRILIGISVIAVIIILVVLMIDRIPPTTLEVRPALQEESDETKPAQIPEFFLGQWHGEAYSHLSKSLGPSLGQGQSEAYSRLLSYEIKLTIRHNESLLEESGRFSRCAYQLKVNSGDVNSITFRGHLIRSTGTHVLFSGCINNTTVVLSKAGDRFLEFLENDPSELMSIKGTLQRLGG